MLPRYVDPDYGMGWEDECFEETLRDARAQLRCYRENSRFPSRMVRYRELNTKGGE